MLEMSEYDSNFIPKRKKEHIGGSQCGTMAMAIAS